MKRISGVALIMTLWLIFTGIIFAGIVLPLPRTTGDFKLPDKFSALPDNVQFDTILLKYSGDSANFNQAGNVVLQQIKGGRVIIYPEGYVPILVKEDQVDEAKKQLGPSVIICRVGLE